MTPDRPELVAKVLGNFGPLCAVDVYRQFAARRGGRQSLLVFVRRKPRDTDAELLERAKDEWRLLMGEGERAARRRREKLRAKERGGLDWRRHRDG